MRVLLVEHVDATGAAPEDARARMLALKHAAGTLETIVLDGRADDDLQYRAADRRTGPAVDTFTAGAAGRRALARRVQAIEPSLVLWASATPGGGEAAAVLRGVADAWWWPTGHAPAGVPAGPLRALPGAAAPCAGCALEAPKRARQRLSLWDGPFVLVPAPLGEATARDVLEGFASAASGRDEMDLVLLDHPNRRLEALAREHGVDVRTHFVGPAPREAEGAWLATATAVLVPGDAPLSGGLLLRALAAGAVPIAVGAAAAPIADWLDAAGCAWARPRDAEALGEAVERVLEHAEAAKRARERARSAAAAFTPAALAARVQAALGGPARGAEAA